MTSENYFYYTPTEITELQHLLRNISGHEVQKINLDDIIKKSKIYHQFLRKIYQEWFSTAKEYSETYVADRIFTAEISKDDVNIWVQINLYSLIKTVKRIKDRLVGYQQNNKDVPKGQLLFFHEIVFDSIEFLNVGYFYLTGQETGNNTHRRRNIMSHEIFYNSKSIINRELIQDDIVTIPSSIFFIRQAIEIKLKNAFGISSILNKEGKQQKITADYFLKLVDENSADIQFPVKKSIIKQIHSWTNYYIHGAVIFYFWHIEWAHYLLEPLFLPGVAGGRWSISGAITMKRSYYASIEFKIKSLLKNDDLVIRRMKSPEAIIIEDED
jgi:hypothetical protein